MNDTQRELLAIAMVPKATELVCAVRESPAAVQQALAGLTQQDVLAVLVVLAAMVPDDRTVGSLLAWADPELAAVEKVPHMSDAELRPLHAAHERYRAAVRAGLNPAEPSALVMRGEREYQRRAKAYQTRALRTVPVGA